MIYILYILIAWLAMGTLALLLAGKAEFEDSGLTPQWYIAMHLLTGGYSLLLELRSKLIDLRLWWTMLQIKRYDRKFARAQRRRSRK